MLVSREVTVDQPIESVFAYLSDFTTTTQWDPATVRTVRAGGRGGGDGDGNDRGVGVGTVYRNTSRFAGRTTDLTYVVTELRAPERIALRGENSTVVAVDTMTLVATEGGTRVTYRAAFTFKGAWRIVAPIFGPAFRRLGDGAAAGLRAALESL